MLLPKMREVVNVMIIKISQSVAGLDRKLIGAVISEAIGSSVSYAGPPSFAYNIGAFSISKDSIVSFDFLNDEYLTELKKGFDALVGAEVIKDSNLTISISEFSMPVANRMRNVLESKFSLIKKSLQAELDLNIESDCTKVNIKFLTSAQNGEKIAATVMLFLKLAEFAKTLKYVTAAERIVENEKYALRCFLIRLGLNGEKYKGVRKELIKNLDGNSAFKNKVLAVQDND